MKEVLTQAIQRTSFRDVVAALGVTSLMAGLVLTFSAGVALIVLGVLFLGAVVWGVR